MFDFSSILNEIQAEIEREAGKQQHSKRLFPSSRNPILKGLSTRRESIALLSSSHNCTEEAPAFGIFIPMFVM